jgi:hypothetical protein
MTTPPKTRIVNDWEKVVRSLIKFLKKDGIESWKADNGEDEDGELESASPTKLAERVCECDEGWLYVRKGDMKLRLYIVLGNGPEEIVSDWSYKTGTDDQPFQIAWNKFMAYWETRKVPQREETR